MSIFSKLNLTNFFGLSEDEDYEENEFEQEPKVMNGYNSRPAAVNQGTYSRTNNERLKKASEPARKENEPKREASKVVTFNSSSTQKNQNREGQGESNPRPERKKETAVGRGKIIVMEPRVYSEAMNIAKCIIRQEAVIVNFRLVEEYQARRIVDFLTGTVYALDGDIQRVGDEIFLCTPQNMEIDGATAKDIFGEGSQFFDY